MDSDLRAMLLNGLTARKRELESILRQSMSTWKEWGPGTGGEDPADEVDDAHCETSTHNHFCLMERRYREYRKVAGLIQRMQAHEEYGLCEECGEAIPMERLIVMPEATYCVPCQRRMERIDGLKLYGAWRSGRSSERRNRDWENPDDEETAFLDSHMDSLTLPNVEEPAGESPFDEYRPEP